MEGKSVAESKIREDNIKACFIRTAYECSKMNSIRTQSILMVEISVKFLQTVFHSPNYTIKWANNYGI